MTKQQFEILADLLGIEAKLRVAARKALFDNGDSNAEIADLVDKLRQADAVVRSVYVIHGPMAFRITVGHRDTHRMPGAIRLQVGDAVRLVAQSTERWVPVRVTALPDSPADYYTGVIIEQLVKASRFQAGDGVKFSEDQVLLEAPKASRRGHNTFHR